MVPQIPLGVAASEWGDQFVISAGRAECLFRPVDANFVIRPEDCEDADPKGMSGPQAHATQAAETLSILL